MSNIEGYYNNVFVPAMEQLAERLKGLAEQIKEQTNA